ncbi:HypC/HybG/HupF family hydrogenase formation chaperone [Candidatus Bathyarchaeota archaeon]|nr:MAG: HypC/HybG/HupF family hydrogenase formation chaperone [Candidatus Bathyarchaeota archaeon]
MCLAIPGKVESIEYPFAIVDFKGAKRKVRVDLIDDLKVGDYVLVHVGFAIQKVDKNEAERIEELISKIIEI